MLDVRYSHLYFYQSLNRLRRGLSAIAELLVKYTMILHILKNIGLYTKFMILCNLQWLLCGKFNLEVAILKMVS